MVLQLSNDVTKFFLFNYIKSIKMYGNKFIFVISMYSELQ